MTVDWSGNKIVVLGKPAPQEIHYVANGYHRIVQGSGFKEVILDFSDVLGAFETFILPIVCAARYYRKVLNVDTILVPPADEKLAALFHNANWQHLIDPDRYAESTFSGIQHLPAMVFDEERDPETAVDRIIDMILSSFDGLEHQMLKATQWAIGEIVGNVSDHAQSPIGGLIQASTFSGSKVVEFVVADYGIGIAASLGELDHRLAIERAIQEGVTRNKITNQGNGLFGTYQLAIQSGGRIQIHSHRASLNATANDVRYFDNKAFFHGTVVSCRIDCSVEDILSKALVFSNRVHDPAFDYIEKKFETGVDSEFVFKMSDEAYSVTSRRAAAPVRQKVLNLLKMDPSARLVVDFADVHVVTSSFADEVFGKLFFEIGPMNFMRRIQFDNIDSTVQGLIDRAIMQRSSVGLSDE